MKISELKNPVEATQQSARRRHGTDQTPESEVLSRRGQTDRQQTVCHGPESVLKSAFSIKFIKNSKIKKPTGNIHPKFRKFRF